MGGDPHKRQRSNLTYSVQDREGGLLNQEDDKGTRPNQLAP